MIHIYDKRHKIIGQLWQNKNHYVTFPRNILEIRICSISLLNKDHNSVITFPRVIRYAAFNLFMKFKLQEEKVRDGGEQGPKTSSDIR